MNDAVLIYPQLGSFDGVVADLPLSIIYAAANAVKCGQKVELLDLRLINGDWRPSVRAVLDKGTHMVGISVMTGMPLINAREISLLVREEYPDVKVVWGGPHPTVLPDTIEEGFLDFTVRGYGSQPLADLIEALNAESQDFSNIDGLSWKNRDGKAVHNTRSSYFETLSYTDLPYDLIDVRHPGYRRSYLDEPMFSLFGSIGCPYQCTFCISPATLKDISGKKWMPYPEEEVVGHIQMAMEKYGFSNFCFIDDTSFPSLPRMRHIFELIIERGLDIRIEFRGARVNEMAKMDDDFIQLMIRAGGRVLKVGAESASNRLLKLMKKAITKEQLLTVNEKFARYPEITIDYNFFCGSPGETYEDLRETKDVVLELLRVNKNALYSYGADWKPIPGTEMLELAEKEFGYKAPETLEEWAAMDSFDNNEKIVHPWYTKEHDNLIRLLQVAAFVIDDKIVRGTRENKTLLFRIARLMARIYKPIAMWRLRHNVHQFMIEYDMYRFASRLFLKLQQIGIGKERHARQS